MYHIADQDGAWDGDEEYNDLDVAIAACGDAQYEYDRGRVDAIVLTYSEERVFHVEDANGRWVFDPMAR